MVELTLKPCPFCAQQLERNTNNDAYWSHPNTAATLDCIARTLHVYDGPGIVAAWNTRARIDTPPSSSTPLCEHGHTDRFTSCNQCSAREIEGSSSTPEVVEAVCQHEHDARGEAMICEGCGTTRTIEAILARHGPQAIACCPERKMIPARWYWEKARAAIAALPPSNSLEDGSERTSNMSLPAYARWASRALNRLSGGGSEMFMRLSDGEYYADPDLAVERANHRTDAMRKLGIPSNMIGEVSSECAACKARERDAWAPDPDDPFWMLEVRQGFDNAGAWAKNLETCLTTREPIKALRFPSRFAAEVARRRLYPLDDQFEPTEHSWIVMPPRSTAISEAIDCPLCKQIGEVLAKSIGGAVHYAVEPELSTVDYSFALRDEAGELHRLLCDIHPLDEDGCFKNGSEARALASRGEKL